MAKNEPRPNPNDGYWAFTRAFDRELRGHDLSKQSQHFASAAFRQLQDDRSSIDHERQVALERVELAESKLQKTRTFRTSEMVVSLLIDHSGSMRGENGLLAYQTVDIASEMLSRLGIRHEILGFTTSAWQGGNARKLWIAEGQPANPRRLNDLLHIVYRDAYSTEHGVPRTLMNLLFEQNLKENVDGEALLWAAKRLISAEATHRHLVIISDGAPVDDSTLHENDDDFLWAHLHRVIDFLTHATEIQLHGIGINYSVSRLYGHSTQIQNPRDVADLVPEFLRVALTSVQT